MDKAAEMAEMAEVAADDLFGVVVNSLNKDKAANNFSSKSYDPNTRRKNKK
jgi:hypothetical protein